MFFRNPELPPTDPLQPQEDLRSLLGETFICIENWVVPVGEHTHEHNNSGLGNYVWMDYPASSFENMPHILSYNAAARECNVEYGLGGNVMGTQWLNNTPGLMPCGCGVVRCRFNVDEDYANIVHEADEDAEM